MQWGWLNATNLSTVVTIFAIIGGIFAAIKTISAGIQRLKTRHIAVERCLTSEPSIGNNLTMVNLSDKPLLISAWDIVWARYRPWGRSVTMGAFDGDEDSLALTIPPHSRKRFNFTDAHYFPTNAKMQDRYGHLYCRIWLAGSNRAKWFKLL